MNAIGILRYGDNYIYIVHDTNAALAVDPGSAQPVLSFLKEHDLQLSAVLITHHHGDHTGGVSQLQRETGCTVLGPKTRGAGNVDTWVNDGDEKDIAGILVRVIAVPGHTKDHVVYHIPALNTVFTGDTMFVAGCGRLFGGSAKEMYDSLQKIASLGDDVNIYCGHDYTEENLRFALTVEPGNEYVQEKLVKVRDTLSQGGHTVPSTIAEEKKINVFLGASDVNVFAGLRRKKDSF